MAQPSGVHRIVMALAVAAAMLLVVALLPYAYAHFPELFGHFDFYRTCKSLDAGMSIADARAKMSAFPEVGRTLPPPAGPARGFLGARVPGVSETKREHATRLLFVPNPRELADWCIVYLDASGSTVTRVEISPD